MHRKIFKNLCQGECPQCGSVNLDYETILDLSDNNAYYSFVCEDCHYEGKEWYELKYIRTE